MKKIAQKDSKPTSTSTDSRQSRVAGQDPPNRTPRVAPPESLVTLQRKVQEQQQAPIQKQKSSEESNSGGLPSGLKSGVEQLSGVSMDDVQVHYNSDKPAQLKAHAYTKGTEIHVGPGQESSLPHEAWHAAQQKQGRVQATTQFKGNVAVNDDSGLETEADIMGAKALAAGRNLATQQPSDGGPARLQTQQVGAGSLGVIQGKWYGEVSSGRPKLAPSMVGGPVFTEVADRLAITHSDTNEKIMIKAGQSTLDGSEVERCEKIDDPDGVGPIEYNKLPDDTLQIMKGHPQFVARAVYGGRIAFEDQPTEADGANENEWPKMKWANVAAPQHAQALNNNNNNNNNDLEADEDLTNYNMKEQVKEKPQQIESDDKIASANYEQYLKSISQLLTDKTKFSTQTLNKLKNYGLNNYESGTIHTLLDKKGYLPQDFVSVKSIETTLNDIAKGNVSARQNLKKQQTSTASVRGRKNLLASTRNLVPTVPDVNINDISVGQGLYMVKTKAQLNGGEFGLQTDGVGPCVAVALANPDRTVFAFSHFDGQTDAAAAIDCMLQDIGNDVHGQYHAWIGQGSKDKLLKEVQDALKARNVLLHVSIDGYMQYRVNPKAKELKDHMTATEAKSFPVSAYADSVADSMPLPYNKIAADVIPYTVKVFGQLSAFMKEFSDHMVSGKDKDLTVKEKLEKLFSNNKLVAYNAVYLVSNEIHDVKTLSIDDVVAIVELTLELVNDNKSLVQFKDKGQLRSRLRYILELGRGFIEQGYEHATYLSGMSNNLTLGGYL